MHNKNNIKNNKSKSFKLSFIKSAKSLWNMLPFLFGIVLLISLITSLIPSSFYLHLFKNNVFLDSIIGAILGSVSAGNPIISYVIGGELLKSGISLIAVTAFLVSWITVGIIQIPLEISYFGKKFSLFRNLFAFILSIFVALVIVSIVGVL